jgi:acetylornithine deacetylase/succinyl-diaminopimelate desuccinylase-like protein
MVRFTFWNAGLLCAALGLTLAPAAQAAGPMPPPAYQAMARDILKELIETNSIHANGSTVAAQRVAKLALVAGFAPGDVTVLAPPERPTKGNVVIRLHGKGLGKPLLIIGHLDVVEANPRDWTTDPFKLIEKDGYYYGRGTEDMKGDDALILTALIRMKKEGFVPDRDIIAAFTADEEGGGEEPGVQWLFDKHRDLVESGLALNVDGDGAVWKNGVPYYVGVETSEKLYATYELETTNKGGHSSLPRADNAIYQLTTGLQKLAAYRFPLRLTDTTRSYFRELGRLQKGETGADMLALAGPAPEAAAGRLSADPVINALLRTTCVTTMLRAGEGESALPSRAHATVQCRIMPGETPEATQATLVSVLGDPGIHVTADGPIDPSPETALTADVLARYHRLVDQFWPHLPVIPDMSPGASDSVYARLAGVPSYVSGAILFDIDDSRAHGRDERVNIAAFDQGGEYAYWMLKVFSAR